MGRRRKRPFKADSTDYAKRRDIAGRAGHKAGAPVSRIFQARPSSGSASSGSSSSVVPSARGWWVEPAAKDGPVPEELPLYSPFTLEECYAESSGPVLALVPIELPLYSPCILEECYEELGARQQPKFVEKLQEVCRSKVRDQLRRKKYYEGCREIYLKSAAAMSRRNLPRRQRFAAIALGPQYEHFEELCKIRVAEQKVRMEKSGSVPPPAPSFSQGISPTLVGREPLESSEAACVGFVSNQEDSCLQPLRMEPLAVRRNLGRFIKRHLSIIADRKCRVQVLPNTRRNRRATSQRGDRVLPNGEIEIEWADMLKLSPTERAPPPAPQFPRPGECSPPPALQFDLLEQAQQELGWR